MTKPIFDGVVYDEEGHLCPVRYLDGEPHYEVQDQGLRFYVPTETVDRRVLGLMRDQLLEHEDAITDVLARLLGQEDPFSRAALRTQLRNFDRQWDALFEQGLPPLAKQWLAQAGLRVVINFRGEVVELLHEGEEMPEDFLRAFGLGGPEEPPNDEPWPFRPPPSPGPDEMS
ncbi:MAG: hypothetical protein GXO54_06735 [Chloroflexi bacterium]|nr:hypothetical protein [Chloroflexota bacterium]